MKSNMLNSSLRIQPTLFLIALLCLAGCNQDYSEKSYSMTSNEPYTVAEGIIYSVEYQLKDGKSGGFTRLNFAEAVPGGNGSFNVDAYGILTSDYLTITYPQRKGLGPRIIPASRILDIQFGDGGFKKIDESNSHSTAK